LERFKFEQLRLQHEEEERRLVEQHKLEEELRKKRESSVTRERLISIRISRITILVKVQKKSVV